MYKSHTVLVTGSQGYIGKNLCKYLLNMGYNIIQVDLKNPNKLNISQIEKNILENIDCVIHLAACPSISYCEENIDEAINNNILYSLDLIDKCIKSNTPIIFASSIAAQNPKTSFYSLSKYIIENKLLSCFNMKSVSLRFSNVYGGTNYLTEKTSVISNFVNKLNNNEKLIINGDGTQKRDFIYIDELCKVIEIFTRTLSLGMFIDKQIFPIGTGFSYSINNLASKMIEIKTNNKSNIDDLCIYNKDNKNIGVYSSIVDLSNLSELFNSNFFNYLKKDLPKDLLDDYLREVL